MRELLNPNIFVFGLIEEEIEAIEANMPSETCRIIDTDQVTDLIAIGSFAIFINPKALSPDDLDLLIGYYADNIEFIAESVFFTEKFVLPEKLQSKFRMFDNFSDLTPNIKYLLLSAYHKSKKAFDFSRALSGTIWILSEIRKHPGITTKQLAEHLELSTRTVQRYIEALRLAGESIDYDIKLKGWKLSFNKSMLLDDDF